MLNLDVNLRRESQRIHGSARTPVPKMHPVPSRFPKGTRFEIRLFQTIQEKVFSQNFRRCELRQLYSRKAVLAQDVHFGSSESSCQDQNCAI